MENQENIHITQNKSEYIEEFDDPLCQPGRIFLAQINLVVEHISLFLKIFQ